MVDFLNIFKVVKKLLYNGLVLPFSPRLIDSFHKLYYDASMINGTWMRTYWFGTNIFKYPGDIVSYQEIIYQTKPDLIIECGAANGGSSLFLSHLCELMGHGRVLSIDIEDIKRPRHKRLKYLIGSTTEEKIIKKVKRYMKNKRRIMVILDSDHSANHVFNELVIYSQFVTKGCYLIIEDTNLNGHPVEPNTGAGPMEAVNKFNLQGGFKKFELDRTREKFLVTFNPKGYYKRK